MDRPLVPDFDGCMVFSNNRNLIYLEIPSLISPGEYSPEGKYVHTAYGAPENFEDANLEEELKRTIDELELNFPGFKDEAEILVKAKFSGKYPAGRRAVGRSMPVNTPIRGLYMVGDGNAERGKIGTESAASSGRLAAEQIKQRYSKARL
jgi:phytoene dehydrogenase-like protein